MLVKEVLEKALLKNCISRQDWEFVLELAAVESEVVSNGESISLSRLVALLEGGLVAVDGVPQTEILRRLAVFA